MHSRVEARSPGHAIQRAATTKQDHAQVYKHTLASKKNNSNNNNDDDDDAKESKV